jgi:hypothetical protein
MSGKWTIFWCGPNSNTTFIGHGTDLGGRVPEVFFKYLQL